jgi:hypothetical protein
VQHRQHVAAVARDELAGQVHVHLVRVPVPARLVVPRALVAVVVPAEQRMQLLGYELLLEVVFPQFKEPPYGIEP